MVKNDKSSGSKTKCCAVLLVTAIITKKHLTAPEPLACATMRDTLHKEKHKKTTLTTKLTIVSTMSLIIKF